MLRAACEASSERASSDAGADETAMRMVAPKQSTDCIGGFFGLVLSAMDGLECDVPRAGYQIQ